MLWQNFWKCPLHFGNLGENRSSGEGCLTLHRSVVLPPFSQLGMVWFPTYLMIWTWDVCTGTFHPFENNTSSDYYPMSTVIGGCIGYPRGHVWTVHARFLCQEQQPAKSNTVSGGTPTMTYGLYNLYNLQVCPASSTQTQPQAQPSHWGDVRG